MIRSLFLLFLLSACHNNNGVAQIDALANSENYYAIDTVNKIIVCHSKLMAAIENTSEIKFSDKTYTFVNPSSKLTLSESYKVVNDADTLSLYFTNYPLIKINSAQEIKDEPKNMASFSYADATDTYNESIGIELRGNSALKYPKKSYDLEIREAIDSEESKSLKFGDLRKDDDWILNSLYNEPLKLRSFFSTKIWLELTNTEDSPKKINDVLFTEVFLNNKYQGLYLLSEQVDRKQLQLAKLENGVAKGLLYKGNSAQDGTTFKKPTEFKNALPTWSGFEMKYPYENYDSHWEGIHQLVSLVSENDTEFKAKIEQQLDIDNAIDYYLFVNLLRAPDNLGKNYFIARKDTNTPFFFIPWDLDGLLGNVTDGIRVNKTEDILTNHLFEKLLNANPANYRSKMKARWKALRSTNYSNESLFNKLQEITTTLEQHKVYERDAIAWPANTTVDDDSKYLTTWLEKRLLFLDSHFDKMED